MNRSIENQKLINEKTIQRFIFEQLNYGNTEILVKFYPTEILKGIQNKKIKVLVPNYPLKYSIMTGDTLKERQHITDFRVIYNDNTYHNIEVEWKTSRFSSHGVEVYNEFYKDGKGFLIVFEDDAFLDEKVNYVQSKYVKSISAEDFSNWYALKAKSIVDETITNYVPNYTSHGRRVWLIYLASSGANCGFSKNSYLANGRMKGKWAFRYSHKGQIMKNILSIYGGDIVIFIWGLKVINGTHQRQIDYKNDWYFTGIDITKVKKGYYCDFNDDTFEKEEWKINRNVEEKEYMHYIQFNKDYIYSSSPKSEKKYLYKNSVTNVSQRIQEMVGFIGKLNKALNTQGMPIEITKEEYNTLLGQIGLF